MKVKDMKFIRNIKTHYIQSTVSFISDREINVILPMEYNKSKNKKYPVIYMQDGQNCLDEDAFGFGGWKVHKTLYDLEASGDINPPIIVLIPNVGESSEITRTMEYTPVPYYNYGGFADYYINFLIRDVIPFIESKYRTQNTPGNRCIAGSSFAGLLSFYAGFRYSIVFGKSIAMSPSLWWCNNWMLNEVDNTAGYIPNCIFYLDSGGVTVEGIETPDKDITGGLMTYDDARMLTIELKELLISKGYTEGKEIKHYSNIKHTHNEKAWRERFPTALKFMFPTK